MRAHQPLDLFAQTFVPMGHAGDVSSADLAINTAREQLLHIYFASSSPSPNAMARLARSAASCSNALR
jgi:hypothetical protein